jgi:alkanesulfonate monooxygenase SsuD/methylene tetrahydromethanopterin reductase-like flavin-dependent oxidoreductase (luciferase family)
MANAPLFGANIDPNTDLLEEAYRRADLADTAGLDMITMQDHPYQRRFLDTWTLLTTLAVRTKRVHVGTDVANLPLRPPAMLAKMAASLDVISGGRVELGLGAGGFWQAIEAWGVPARSPKQAYDAFEDAVHIIKGMWENPGKPLTYEGSVYSVKGLLAGPAPAHPIRLWVGANGPKMMRLTGRMADGIIVSNSYVPPQRLLENNALIDEGAAEVGRSPDDIRRGYNLMGMIDTRPNASRPAQLPEGALYGTPQQWIEELQRLYHDYRQDAFFVWPFGDNGLQQLEVFANEIVPAVREALGAQAG